MRGRSADESIYRGGTTTAPTNLRAAISFQIPTRTIADFASLFHFFTVPMSVVQGPRRCQFQMTSATDRRGDCFVPWFFSSSIVVPLRVSLYSRFQLPRRTAFPSSPLFRIALRRPSLPSLHVIRRSGAVKIKLMSRGTRRLRLSRGRIGLGASRGWSKFLNE